MILVLETFSSSGEIGLYMSSAVAKIYTYHGPCGVLIGDSKVAFEAAKCGKCGKEFTRAFGATFDLTKVADAEVIEVWAAEWLEVPRETVKVEVS